ncbi:MAG: EB domain-containing protein [Myxococcota bacterium]
MKGVRRTVRSSGFARVAFLVILEVSLWSVSACGDSCVRHSDCPGDQECVVGVCTILASEASVGDASQEAGSIDGAAGGEGGVVDATVLVDSAVVDSAVDGAAGGEGGVVDATVLVDSAVVDSAVDAAATDAGLNDATPSDASSDAGAVDGGAADSAAS